MAAPGSRYVLAALLAALAALFAAWFSADPRYLQALAVFALPPLLLMAGVLAGSRVAVFWSGVLGLGWFCHGVMVGWERAAGRGYALGEVALALAIIVAASWPGLQARFGRRGARGATD
ncbi:MULTISPECIES: DUF2069 domain-containing protein [unclassified Luteimonas]|uniref:DUF2069 domain-containing protein n=1 Tax=unclassified Luteimonas TaxID=2629088 RepID=UPI0015FEBDFF|nr:MULTISPECIES: DUF2069 domain-containing protein [unclassified Luteimonas]MBB1473909.1 DUF2069 domain-containing protein [Luteimonas sp. MC1782]MBB6599861.1 DUF2069 domain-containing protein [Luteimonas sp. MC1825]QOC87577.1 DUF2069 domain-containing protein [Luteimonas sp. MC1825]